MSQTISEDGHPISGLEMDLVRITLSPPHRGVVPLTQDAIAFQRQLNRQMVEMGHIVEKNHQTD